MEIIRQLLFVWAIWCFLDKVHSAHISSEDFSECGKSKKDVPMSPQIVGGENATLGSWPWMVALFHQSRRTKLPKFRFDFYCGGSLISNQWVITAAHCAHYDVDKIFVRLGDLNIDERVDDGASPKSFKIDRAVVHPKYEQNSQTSMDNDIALIHLEKPVTFTENIRPICLLRGQEYESDEYYDGIQAFITGWGLLGKHKDASYHLQETFVTGIPLKTCIQQYSDKPYVKSINEKVICASEPGKDACQGDSGGPLMYFNKTENRFYLGGITSLGEGCAHKDFAGVYTKVAQFIPWIKSVTDESF